VELGGGNPGRGAAGAGEMTVDDLQRMLGATIAPVALANATIVRDGEVIQQGRPSIERTVLGTTGRATRATVGPAPVRRVDRPRVR
jgi:hypothetical protein